MQDFRRILRRKSNVYVIIYSVSYFFRYRDLCMSSALTPDITITVSLPLEMPGSSLCFRYHYLWSRSCSRSLISLPLLTLPPLFIHHHNRHSPRLPHLLHNLDYILLRSPPL